ncbi:HK97 family phage prohead protease [Sphingomonas sp. PvP055]|uniref:HK97 family phage prohead protease n=1 Tax=Sphingomonas sp. PvP055 TaxID=3156391 RepID=UPI00339623DD
MQYAESPFEIKSLNDSGQIEGLLAGFGNVDSGGDRLIYGAFTKSLAARTTPLPMLLHHDMKRPVGVWRDWQERAEGLHVKGSLTLASRDAQEAYALAKDGALTGLSIGWAKGRGNLDPSTGVRTIEEAELHEGSLVTFPMNEKTRVTSIKSIGGARDIEALLQESGMSGRKAKAAASAAWKAINTNDDDEAEAQAAALFNASAARIAAIGAAR